MMLSPAACVPLALLRTKIMTNDERIRAFNEKGKKLPVDRAKKAILIGLELGRRMRMHVNARAKKASG